jgi:hypothetical protein
LFNKFFKIKISFANFQVYFNRGIAKFEGTSDGRVQHSHTGMEAEPGGHVRAGAQQRGHERLSHLGEEALAGHQLPEGRRFRQRRQANERARHSRGLPLRHVDLRAQSDRGRRKQDI